MPGQTWHRVLGARLVYLLDWECRHYFSPCYNRIPDERTFREEGCLWSHSVKTPEGKRGSMRARQLAARHLQSGSREQRREQLLSSLPLYFVFSPVPQSMVIPTFRVAHLSSLHPIWKLPHKYTKVFSPS